MLFWLFLVSTNWFLSLPLLPSVGNGETVTDVQLGYTFQNGPLKNFGILLQVNNLENEPFTSSFTDTNRPREYFEYGRTYLFGVNYRY